jgi:hypothetical protein
LRKKKKYEIDESISSEFKGSGLVVRAVHKSRKNIDQIDAEIEGVLSKLGIEWEKVKKGKQYQCKDPKTGAIFKVDIHTSEVLDTMREVKFRPVGGSDANKFREIFLSLCNEVKL